MKKISFSFKSLLVAAGLLIGSANAWGDETRTPVYSNDFEESSGWTANGKTDGWTCNPGTTTANTFASKVIGVGSGSGDMGLLSPAMGINPELVSIVDVEMKFKMDACTGSKSSGIEFVQPSGVTIAGGYISSGTPFFSINANASSNGYWGTITVGGTDYKTILNQASGTYENNSLNRNTTGIVVLNARFNFTTKETTFTLKTVGGETLVASTTVAFADVTATTLDKIYVHAGKSYGGVTIDDVNVYSVETSATYADYTVHFIDNNGETVKDDEVRSGEVGSTVNANSTDKEIYYGGGNKYTYNSDGDGVEVVAAGTAELTVVYDKHEPFTATAKAVSGGSTLQTNIASVSGYEGETKTLQLHKYIKVGETWYSTATCYVDVTDGGDKEVTYTATAVKYFYEFESLTGGRTDVTNKSHSGGVSSRVTQSNSLSTPEEIAGGVYVLTIPYNNSNDTAGKLYLYTVKGGAETDTELTIDCPKGNGTVSKTITIPDGAALKFKNTNDSYADNGRIDYFILTPTVSATITEAGWATLYTPYALDFSDVDGLTAYTASLSGSTITLNKVNDVPANTGVVLKGEANTYNIPVIASSSTDKGVLIGKATETTNADTEPGTGKAYYILTKSGSEAKFTPASGTIAAGKAYLEYDWTDVGSSVKALSIVFDDGEATGIAAPEVAEKAENGVLYNLNGQQVTADFRGIVIKNGKKYFNK